MPKIPTVLLVDDDPTTNFLNKKLLLRLGVTDNVRVALNGQEALDEVQGLLPRKAGRLPGTGAPGHQHTRYERHPVYGCYQQLPAEQQRAVVVVMLITSVSPRDQQVIQAMPIADYLAELLTQQQVERIMAQHF